MKLLPPFTPALAYLCGYEVCGCKIVISEHLYSKVLTPTVVDNLPTFFAPISAVMYTTFGLARSARSAKFQRINIERNVGGELDVTIDVKFCGVCHSDVHIADNDMGTTQYPCVPGHELAGVVVRKVILFLHSSSAL